MTAPGWYPDPRDPRFVRWWNGQTWTEHVHPNAQQPIAHVAPLRAPAPQPVVQVERPPEPQNPPEPRKQLSEIEERLELRRRELESVEEAIDIQSFGFYRPKYGFESSEQYTERLKDIREQQKRLIKDDGATQCATVWKIDGSLAEGKKMIRQLSKLMLRAFNGECDAAIAKARYDNVVMLEGRITKARADINALGAANQVSITDAYCDLKLAELHLVHEHREKAQEEKEEQRRIREQMREEQKARDEIERAQADAEKEEDRYERALEKARAELAESEGKQHEKFAALVSKLETELKDAIDRKAKAIARAQLTKSGHVYVLSNVGSFGEGVYKIGLTRRLDPYERVDELGDASVPFGFDVHAIIYAEDAPALEAALHREFADHRVNLVNPRKEYFRVSLDGIREAVERHHGLVTFALRPEAEEWRKTRAMLEVSAEPLADADVVES